MAVPLPVIPIPLETEIGGSAALNPIATPYEFPVLAQTVVVYPGAEAEDVYVDYYFYDPVAAIDLYPGGSVYGPCATEEVPATDPCGVPIISVGTNTFKPVIGSSAITFEWEDVASFFWYYPDGSVVAIYDPPTADPGVDVSPICAAPEGTVTAVCAAAEGTVGAVCASAEVVVARSPVCTPVEIAVKRR